MLAIGTIGVIGCFVFIIWMGASDVAHNHWGEACLDHHFCEYDKATGKLVWVDDRKETP